MNLYEEDKPLLILAGPTAVGKSDISVKVAKALGGECISADSIQVYKGLNIGSGKITEEEKEELEEAGILEDISHMPARVKCAVLGWRTMDEIFKDADEGKIDKYSGKFD